MGILTGLEKGHFLTLFRYRQNGVLIQGQNALFWPGGSENGPKSDHFWSLFDPFSDISDQLQGPWMGISDRTVKEVP